MAGSFDNGVLKDAYIYIFDGKTDTLEWKSNDLGGEVRLAVADTDDDGTMDIVCGSRDGYLSVFDAVSHELKWKSRDMGGYMRGVAAEDIDNDGTVEILAGNAEGELTVFDGKTYEKKWTLMTGNDRTIGWIGPILVDDLDADGVKEILFGLLEGHGLPARGIGYVYIYDGKSRALKWKSGPLEQFTWVYDAYDVDGDGIKEILAGGKTTAYVLKLGK